MKIKHRYNNDEAFGSAVREFIEDLEGSKPKIYLDSQNKPTIGIGYLIEKDEWESEFVNAGINLNRDQVARINKLLDDILSETTKDGKKDAVETYNREKDSLDLDSTQRENLFFSVINKYKNMVDDKLGNTLSAHYANSSEKVVLVSLVYNEGSKMIGPNLSAALIEGDRVKAWYEIRYNSNSQNQTEETQRGIANRRIDESNLFGLYDDPENIDINEAKHTYRFLESKRNEIQNKITHIRNLKGNIDTIKLAKDDLDVQLKATRDLILNTFAKDKNINGSIIIGKGIGDPTDDFRDIGNDFNDEILRGTNKNDLIFGEKGHDVINGGRGNDVLYGASDDRDDDVADTLKGGTGFDTYYVGDKDIIFDSDGKGKVVFDTVELKGGTYDKDKGAYVSKDGLIEYRLNESGGKSTLTVQKGGKSITINEFSKEDKSLGITLLDANEIGISISDNQTNEGDSGKKSLDFNISLQGSIEKGEFLILGVGDKEYLFGDPSEEYIKKYNLNLAKYERGNIYTYTWDGNTIKQEDREFEITPRIIQTSDKLKAKILKSGTGKIIDDDDDPGTPNDTFPDTTPASTKTSPIVIDLNGDGVKTISRKNGKTYFDLDNNKFAENTSWIDKNDGILINKTLIANSVTNGSELFGNHTLLRDGSLANNGFEALKEFDENKDGVINELDALAYENLAIWQDTNQNAKLDDNELKSLKELGIKEINLNYTNSSFIDENGNEHRQTSNVVFENGNKATISDVWLDTHTADTKYIGEKIILSNEIKALPEVTAFGNLHNPRNAMSENSGLENMIKDYIGLNPEEKAKQLDNVLFKWAGVEGNACIKASPNRHYG